MLRYTKSFLLVFSCFLFCSCSTYKSDPVKDAAIGTGVAGTFIGAGAGALIGAAISNGDIGASALLGAGIGLPVGVLAGAWYARSMMDDRLAEYDDTIRRNDEIIESQRKEIDSLRKQTDYDSRHLDIRMNNMERIHNGPSIGNYYR